MTLASKVKILLVTAFGPGKENGGSLVTTGITDALKRRGADVQVITFANSSDKGVSSVSTSVFRRLIGLILFPYFHPLFTGRLSLRVFKRLLKNRKSPELILLNFSQVFIYSLFLRKKNVVLICHDIVYQNYRRRRSKASKALARWIFFSEYCILHAFRGDVACLSRKDARLLQVIYKKRASVIDWGLDDIVRRVSALANKPVSFQLKESKYFCLYGAWDRKENIDGLRWFLNLVADKLNRNIKFCIVGAGLPGDVKEFIAKNQMFRELGFVENPYSVLKCSIALIVPLFVGAGIKIKCLEAMACGVPVIGTRIALEGLQGMVDGRFYLCETAGAFAEAIELLAMNSTSKYILNCDLNEICLSKKGANFVEWSQLISAGSI